MIAELPGGRELRFPDSMSEDDVGRIVRMVLNAESRADEALEAVRAVQTRLDAVLTAPNGETGVVAALTAMRAEMKTGLERIVKAQLAETVLVRDEAGEPNRSKKVMKG